MATIELSEDDQRVIRCMLDEFYASDCGLIDASDSVNFQMYLPYKWQNLEQVVKDEGIADESICEQTLHIAADLGISLPLTPFELTLIAIEAKRRIEERDICIGKLIRLGLVEGGSGQ